MAIREFFSPPLGLALTPGGSNVNIHDSAGLSLTSNGGALNVNVVNGSSNQDVNLNDGAGNPIGSIGGFLDVSANITNFPAFQAVTGPLTNTELRATPVPVSGTITTSPDVNLHDGAGNSISSVGGFLDVAAQVSNFPSTYPVTQSTSPWVTSGTATVSGTVTANIGTTGGLALDATLTNGTQKTKIVDSAGTNVATVSAAGAVKVDGSAVTQPISGTVAATQSGTWTVQPGNTANTTPWLTTDSSDGPVTPGTVATKSGLIGGQYNSTLPTLTNGQQSAIQTDSSGRLLTSTTISSVATTVAPNFSSKLKSEPQLSTIAVPSSVSYTTLYTYSGSGYFIGFNLEFNSTVIVIKLVIDGNTVLDGVDISTYNSLAVTTNSTSRYQAGSGIVSSASTFDFSFRYPIAYSSSIAISARLTSGAMSKNFQQGIVYIQKDT